MEPYAKIELITPEKAKEYLIHNDINRNIKTKKVAAIARDIKAGKYILNGETIVFDENGRLLDGQHRLQAVINADSPIYSFVVYGIKTDTILYDRGTQRSTVDTLVMSGINQKLAKSKIVGFIKLHYLIQTGNANVTDSEIESFILRNEESIIDVTDIATASHHKGLVNTDTASFMAAYYYAIQSGVPKDSLIKFNNIVKTGIYESKEDVAAIIVRNDVLGNRIVWSGGTGRKKACFQIEKGIYDFYHRTQRRASYKNYNEPTYSSMQKFKWYI